MTTPATDEQIAELEALLEGYEDRQWEFPPVPAKEVHAILARLHAAEAEAERIRAEERERLAFCPICDDRLLVHCESCEADGARLFVIQPDKLGWDDIRRFQAEIEKGQDIHEDGGGFFIRAIRALLGDKRDRIVETYQKAAQRMLEESVATLPRAQGDPNAE